MNSERFSPPRGVLLLALTSLLPAMLVACASTGFGRSEGAYSSASSGAAADSAEQRGDYLHAARVYQEQAAEASPQQALELRLRAAEAAANGNDFTLAGNLIGQMPASSLTPDQQLRGRIVNARGALARNDAATALRWLPVDPGNLPSAERAQAVRARALFLSGDTVGGTQAMVLREHYLHDPAAISENRNSLWTSLSTAPLDSSTLARAGSSDPITRGWIELANLARRNASLSFYNNWRQRYPGHPGDERLAALLMPGAPAPGGAIQSETGVLPSATLPATPTQPSTQAPAVVAGNGFAAMLLPQSGPVASAGEAVRAGYAAAAARAGAAAPQVFDSSGTAATMPALVQQAASAGAGLVVGPLLKESVYALGVQAQPPVPVLALNYMDANRPAPTGLYQFGLAPEDEARAAAEDAVGRGLKRALVLVQSGEWGSRVLAAFQQRLSELGGVTVDIERYSGPQESWSGPVQRLLRYHAIEDRKAAAEARAKALPGIDPQRRNDFDFIFMGARSQDHARLLWPLFRFYHAERIAIYATAAVNSGNGDRDVSGIRFCDSPWLLDSRYSAFHDEALAGRNYDSARLYALGADSFLLAQHMTQGGLHPGDQFAGATGTLAVGNDNAIHRGLICARLRVGPPTPLAAGVDPGNADDDPNTP